MCLMRRRKQQTPKCFGFFLPSGLFALLGTVINHRKKLMNSAATSDPHRPALNGGGYFLPRGVISSVISSWIYR